jgi:hypothetical protein
MKNQNLKKDLETKINSLKMEYGEKLSEKQKGLLESLLFAQEQIIRSGNDSSQFTLSSREKVLERAKRSLKTKLSEDEVENLCQLQSELTKMEIELENQVEIKAETSLK